MSTHIYSPFHPPSLTTPGRAIARKCGQYHTPHCQYPQYAIVVADHHQLLPPSPTIYQLTHQPPTSSSTHSLSSPPTHHAPTHITTHSPTRITIHPPTHITTHPPTRSHTHSLLHSLTHAFILPVNALITTPTTAALLAGISSIQAPHASAYSLGPFCCLFGEDAGHKIRRGKFVRPHGSEPS